MKSNLIIRSLAVCTVSLAIALCNGGSVNADAIKTVDRDLSGDHFIGWVPDRIVVQFKEGYSPSTMRKTPNGTVGFVQSSLNDLAVKHVVVEVEKQFPGAVKPFGDENVVNMSLYYKVTFLDGSDPLDVVAAFKNDPNVESAEPIGIHRMYATPNDTYFSPYQTYHNQANDHDIDSPEAWNVQTGSTSIIVADLDSGTRYYHPDLGGSNASPSNPGASRGNMWINNAELNGSAGVDDDGNGYVDDWIGYDFIQSTTSCWSGEDCNTKDNDPRDFNGHGTHTAGIVAMLTNDGYGMAGTAGGWGNGSPAVNGNGVKLMALRMGYSYRYFGQEYGVVLMDAAAEAFYYAANNGAKIATCSWGSSNSGGIGAAVTNFLNGGRLIFVAAGNDGTQTADYLNGRGDCISVAAVDVNDAAASFTTYGTWVDISAPGTAIYSTYHDHADPNTNYWAALDGTSMATPMAAAVGALIWSQNPSWTATQVRNQLYSSADNINAYLQSAYIGKMGAGRINSYNAVNTGGCSATTPVANFSGSPTSGTNPLNVSFTDLSTNSPTAWSWNFGDGGTSTSQNPSHTYTNAGTYTVTLTASNCAGSDPEVKTNYITVSSSCTAPVAEFTADATSGTAPLTVNFSDLSSNSPTSWSWTFGDGGTSTSQNPSHTYTSAGTYNVSLTASNACGSDGETKNGYITVSSGGGSWVTITFDNFETGMGSYTDGGNDMSRYTGGTHSHQGAASADIQDNSGVASSFYHTTNKNVTSYTALEVDFWFKMVSMETNENFFLQYSSNGGSSWQTVANFIQGSGNYSNNTFYHVTVAIPSSFGYTANARLRFMCDASDNNDDVYIDEITFRGFTGSSAEGGPSDVIADGAALPGEFGLDQNYPNPFNPSTQIAFSLPKSATIQLEVFNLLGQKVATIAEGVYNAGVHTVEWDASRYASGVYLYRLNAEGVVFTRKMILVK